MNLLVRRSRVFFVVVFVLSAGLAGGCDTTINETTDNAKNFGTAVGSSAKEAGLKVGDAFKKTFGTKKDKDEASAEIKKAEPAYEEPKKQ